MTLVFEAIPSSGGPRCFWGRARGLPCCLAPSVSAPSFSLVASARGAWSAALASAPSWPS